MHPTWQHLLHAHRTDAALSGAQPASGLVDLSELGVLQLAGPDARSFLQGYTTCDVNELRAGTALAGAHSNLQGRVVADFYLVEHEGALWLVMQRSVTDAVQRSLGKYLPFSKSRLRDDSDAHVFCGVLRPDTRGALLPEIPAPLAVTPLREGFAIGIPGPMPRVLMMTSVGVATEVLDASGKAIADENAWHRIDVEAGIAHVTALTSEQFLPQMLGLGERGAISFTKGCYLGQEVIARAEHRGSLKRGLVRLEWRGDRPLAGTALRDERGASQATVVGAATTGVTSGIALAVGQTSLAPGTVLRSNGTTCTAVPKHRAEPAAEQGPPQSLQ